MRFLLPLLLSVTAGYVDTFGFLALQGLFAAHVTGNFVTLSAALVLGTSGIIAKAIALPVFAIVVALARVLGRVFGERARMRMLAMLACELLLLIAAAVIAIRFGPFPRGDDWQAILLGMLLVSAMAIQNALQRVHLSYAPPSTMMTGNTTQMVMDLVDVVAQPRTQTVEARHRLGRFATVIAAFAIGCALAALLFAAVGKFGLIVPGVLATASLVTALRMPATG